MSRSYLRSSYTWGTRVVWSHLRSIYMPCLARTYATAILGVLAFSRSHSSCTLLISNVSSITRLNKYLFTYFLLKKLLENVCEKMKIFMIKIRYRKKGKLLRVATTTFPLIYLV